MKEGKTSLENVAEDLDLVSTTTAKLIGGLESRMDAVEDEQSILSNHYLNLENRVKFLEKKVLKKKRS